VITKSAGHSSHSGYTYRPWTGAAHSPKQSRHRRWPLRARVLKLKPATEQEIPRSKVSTFNRSSSPTVCAGSAGPCGPSAAVTKAQASPIYPTLTLSQPVEFHKSLVCSAQIIFLASPRLSSSFPRTTNQSPQPAPIRLVHTPASQCRVVESKPPTECSAKFIKSTAVTRRDIKQTSPQSNRRPANRAF
jgi:hypothetical protein